MSIEDILHRGAKVMLLWVKMSSADPETKNPAAVELGRRGGRARAKALSAKERKAIATKASKAAAAVRTRKAKVKAPG